MNCLIRLDSVGVFSTFILYFIRNRKFKIIRVSIIKPGIYRVVPYLSRSTEYAPRPLDRRPRPPRRPRGPAGSTISSDRHHTLDGSIDVRARPGPRGLLSLAIATPSYSITTPPRPTPPTASPGRRAVYYLTLAIATPSYSITTPRPRSPTARPRPAGCLLSLDHHPPLDPTIHPSTVLL